MAEAGQASGPFSPAQLAQAVRDGRIGPQTLVWTAGMAQWAAAGQVPEIEAFLGALAALLR